MGKTSLTYEWTVTGANALYENTKNADGPPSPLCSRPFGGGRWRLFWHCNNGRPGFDGYCGVFLQAEPSLEEKRADIMGRWTRPGRYSFTIDLQSLDGDQTVVTVSTREDVVFTHEKRQWGWPDFATRQDVFENCLAITMHDAFVLTCTIHTMPATPVVSLAPSPAVSSITLPEVNPQGYASLPNSLVEVLRAMVDDPSISNVQFVFPRRINTSQNSVMSPLLNGRDEIERDPDLSSTKTRVISARKDILALRSEYFAQLFAAGTMNGNGSSSPGAVRSGGPGYFHHGVDEEEGETDATNHQGQIPDNADTPTSQNPNPVKDVVFVNDIPYSTYRALIYYLYTDQVVFAPLASHFQALSLLASQPKTAAGVPTGPTNRLEWLRIWKSENRGHALPCSAKSMYAVATRYKLPALRRLAYEFIRKNLTPLNLPFEYFDSFTCAHDDLKILTLQGMVANWEEIQRGPSMDAVWAKIAGGEMPFAKELLPLLVGELSRAAARER